MRGWKGGAVAAGRALEDRFDRLKFDLRRRYGWARPTEVRPYRGHGTARTLYMKGRVLETGNIARSSEADTVRTNLRNMMRRFLSAEVPYARVRATFGDDLTVAVAEAVADEEGFFDLRFELPEPLPEEQEGAAWRPVEVEVVWPEEDAGARATGSVLVPSRASFGVISDLDDTVVKSDVTNLLKMARLALLNNAHTRLPFEGVAAFYRALQRGAGEFNPIFYVSSSPWNLYDLLEDFLDVHGVPAGPLFLKDWGPTTLKGHAKHKLAVIRTLLQTYPELPFVLVGDSGERDPEIYHSVVLDNPGRVRAIYIRDVTTPKRDAEVHAIAREVRASGVEMLLAETTAEAAEHAAANGLITPDALPAIRQASG